MSGIRDEGNLARRHYQARVEPLLRTQLEDGEVMLESCFAQLTAPGTLLLTDRRFMFIGKGVLLRRRPRRVSIPRSEVVGLELLPGRFDTELHINTGPRTFRFFSVNPNEARRLQTAHATHPIVPDGAGITVEDPGPRVKHAPVLVIVAGIAIAFWQPLVGLGIVVVGILYQLLRREHASRVPRH